MGLLARWASQIHVTIIGEWAGAIRTVTGFLPGAFRNWSQPLDRCSSLTPICVNRSIGWFVDVVRRLGVGSGLYNRVVA